MQGSVPFDHKCLTVPYPERKPAGSVYGKKDLPYGNPLSNNTVQRQTFYAHVFHVLDIVVCYTLRTG